MKKHPAHEVFALLFSAAALALPAESADQPRPVDFVEWIQTDGPGGDRNLYIDTELAAENGLVMTAEMSWVSLPGADEGFAACFAGATGTNGKRIWPYILAPNDASTPYRHKFSYNNGALQLMGGGNYPTVGVRYRIESALIRKAQSFTVTAVAGATYSATRTNVSAEWCKTEQPLFLFALNNAGTPEQFSHVRLYSLTIATNYMATAGDATFEVARDFVPCVADNGRAGLYDRVSGRVFFPQAAVDGATAEFDLDAEVGAVTNRPAMAKWPLVRPEWVEADGMDDYVDLGVMARDGTRMLAEVEWNDIPAAGTFCGAATNATRGLFSTYRVTPDFHRMGYYNGSSTLGGANCAPVAGVRYRVETSLADGEQVITVAKSENGSWAPVGAGTRTVNLAFPAGSADLGLQLYLFARNMNGVPDEFAPARLYSFKLWQGDALVRDLAPAFEPADNAPALFDKVSKRYFRNAGGYRLTAGGATSAFPGAGTFWVIK
ncbi:MAG: hypothetical protein IKH04_07590 [Kiritimatiellae bacterium]|nr:hypothetical protein [Kiritimatiellia bacterium]